MVSSPQGFWHFYAYFISPMLQYIHLSHPSWFHHPNNIQNSLLLPIIHGRQRGSLSVSFNELEGTVWYWYVISLHTFISRTWLKKPQCKFQWPADHTTWQFKCPHTGLNESSDISWHRWVIFIILKVGINQSMQHRMTHFVWYQKAPNEDCKAEEWEVWDRESTRIRKNL